MSSRTIPMDVIGALDLVLVLLIVAGAWYDSA